MIARRLVSLVLLLGISLARSGEKDAAGSLIARGPYLQLATPTSIYVVWRTEQRIEPVVRFGRNLNDLNRQANGTNIITRVALGTNKHEVRLLTNRWPDIVKLPKLHSATPGTFQYEALVSGLAPDTLYYYAVFDGEYPLTERDPSYQFRTHPLAGTPRPARFWAVGDSGTGREKQHHVHTAMLNFTAQDKRPIDFCLHLGDMAYSRGRDPEFQTRFFEMYDVTLRNKVCWPTFGNHEGVTSRGTNGVGPYFDAYVCPTNGQAGGVPSGLESFYSFDFGRIHFISLNSHDVDRKPTGAMAKWLKRDLDRTKADWLVAYFHHPPYSKGSHDSDREKQLIEMRTHIMPILESGGVDLVLAGHSHIYERSMLMDGAYATPTVSENVILDDGDGDPAGDGAYRKSGGRAPNAGTVAVVAGHGGTTLRRKATMPVMRKTIVEHGSVIIDINGDTLTGLMIDRFGDRRDLFRIVKRGRITPMHLAYPWQPPYWKPAAGPGGEDPAAEAPEDFIAMIPKNADWQYLTGQHPDGDGWTKPGFDASGWKVGPAGFGYGGQDIRTELPEMKDNYSVVYIRHSFEIEHADQIPDIGLMISYDDAFIAYLNGKEVVRKGVGKSSGKNAKEIKAHDAGKFTYYPLKEFEKALKDGTNVLAIEGHNVRIDNDDFTLDPYLIIED
jgi:hypothetical protein